ncbi:MAG: glycosyltransferase family 2 protein [Pseudomonadota bacterium]
MQEPKFSVVVPVYNRADRILPTLESVRNQTCQDFECIVVDDGSKDGDALKAVVEKLDDPRFRYLRRENGGGGAARNTGIHAATGRYIAFLDSDDQFLPHKLETHERVLETLSDDLIFCYSRLLIDRGVGKTWVKPPNGLRPQQRVDEYLMCGAGWMQTSTVVATTRLAKSVLFSESLPSSQDTDFAVRSAKAGAHFEFIPEALVIMEDRYDPMRVSKQLKYKPLLDWIESMRGTHVSERSYWAYRGWVCARIASYSDRPKAIMIFLQSIIHRPYSLKTSMIIAAQIMIPRTLYQKIASVIVNLVGRTAQEQAR